MELDYFNTKDIPEVNFNSDKIFNNELENILNLLKDTSSDWKKRQSAIIKLGGISKGNYSYNTIFINLLNSKLYLYLYSQISDLRSSLMKEACRTIVLLSEVYKSSFENIVDKLFNSHMMYKLIISANKIIAENVNQAMIAIISNVKTQKTITKIHEQINLNNKESNNGIQKSPIFRLRISQQLYYVILFYSKELIIKNKRFFEDSIILFTPDASSEVRSQARKLYFKYIMIFPEEESKLEKFLENNVLKKIKEEKKLLDCGIISLDLFKDSFKSNSSNNKSISSNNKTNIINSDSKADNKENLKKLNSEEINLSNITNEDFNIVKNINENNKKVLSYNDKYKSYDISKISNSETIKNSKNLINKDSNLYNEFTYNKINTNLNKSEKLNIIDDKNDLIHLKDLKISNSNYSNELKNLVNINSDDKNINKILIHNLSDKLKSKQILQINEGYNYFNKNKEYINKNKTYLLSTIIEEVLNYSDKYLPCIIELCNYNEINEYINYKSIDFKTCNKNIIIDFIILKDQMCYNLLVTIDFLCINFSDYFHSDNIIENIYSNIIVLFSYYINSDIDYDNRINYSELIVGSIDIILFKTFNINNNINYILTLDIVFNSILDIINEYNIREINVCLYIILKYLEEKESRENVYYKYFENELNLNLLLISLQDIYCSIKNNNNDNENDLIVNILDQMNALIKLLINHNNKGFVICCNNLINNNKLDTQTPVFMDFIIKNNKDLSELILLNKNKISNNDNIQECNKINNKTNSSNNYNLDLLTLANTIESSDFYKIMNSNKQNFEAFLFAITKSTENQIDNIIDKIQYIISINCCFAKDYGPLLINRILYIAERYSEKQVYVIKILDKLYKEMESEIYIQILGKYLNERNSKLIMLKLLSHTLDCIIKIDNNNLLLLLPTFIENISNCLNHSNGEIRKETVNIFVELNSKLKKRFSIYMNKLSINHKKLIEVYINKK